jgi:hypothetical protein
MAEIFDRTYQSGIIHRNPRRGDNYFSVCRGVALHSLILVFLFSRSRAKHRNRLRQIQRSTQH